MPQREHNLLAVDWDTFFPNPMDGGQPDKYTVQLFDWGHGETPFFQEAIWPARAAGFLRAERPLPPLSGEQLGFWDRFRFTPRARLFYADSNALAASRKIVTERTRFDQVWLYDAHHDGGYASEPGCLIETPRKRVRTGASGASVSDATSPKSEPVLDASAAARSQSSGITQSTSSSLIDDSGSSRPGQVVSSEQPLKSPNASPFADPATWTKTGGSDSYESVMSEGAASSERNRSPVSAADVPTSRAEKGSATRAASRSQWRRNKVGEIIRRGIFDCGEWMVLYSVIGASLHMRYPRWKARAFDVECEPLVPMDRAFDDGSSLDVVFDRVFVCRSSAWVPPWLDHDQQFLEFLKACPLKHRTELQSVAPRAFSLDSARTEAEITRSFLASFTTGAAAGS